jgi:hypothetical protein
MYSIMIIERQQGSACAPCRHRQRGRSEVRRRIRMRRQAGVIRHPALRTRAAQGFYLTAPQEAAAVYVRRLTYVPLFGTELRALVHERIAARRVFALAAALERPSLHWASDREPAAAAGPLGGGGARSVGAR